jgi:hypothetical protein
VELFKMLVEIAVKRRGLVRIFAVAQTGYERQRERERSVGGLLLVQEAADRAIVIGGFDERLDGKPLAQLQGRFALVIAHVFED